MTANARLPMTDVQRLIDTLDGEEPQTRFAVWRPAYESLSATLAEARRLRNILRTVAVIVAMAAAIFIHRGGWVYEDVKVVVMWALFATIAVEFGSSKFFPVLGREQRIVSLLRYFGSNVVDEEAFS